MSGESANSRLTQDTYYLLEHLLRRDVKPIGDKNSVNLEYLLPDDEKFVPGSLEVHLSGLKLIGGANNPDRDFTERPDQRGFLLRLDPEQPHRLNAPPFQDEPLSINYLLDSPY